MNYEIRPPKAGDGKGINDLRRMPGVFENILGIPSERISRNESFVTSTDTNAHAFVAVVKDGNEEIIIGMAGLHVAANHRLRHSASVGIMVHKAYQGKGVGKALMNALLDIADNWLMLIRVELTVFKDNAKAIALYKQLGFVEEGIKIKAAIRNGSYEDELIMARIRV